CEGLYLHSRNPHWKSEGWNRHALLSAGRCHRVAQEAGDGHRTNAAWNGGDGARHLLARGEVAIPDEPALAVALDAIDADIDDAGPRLDPVALDHFRPPHCGNDEIAPAHHRRQVHGFRMSDGDGAILLEQELHDRLADDVGTPHDHRFESFE